MSARTRRPTADDALAGELRRLDGAWSRAGPTARRRWLGKLLGPLYSSPEPPPQSDRGDARTAPSGDSIGRFLAAATKADPGARVQATKLYKVFEAWANHEGERVVTINWFGRQLAALGLKPLHSNVNWWLDIKLAKSIEDYQRMA